MGFDGEELNREDFPDFEFAPRSAAAGCFIDPGITGYAQDEAQRAGLDITFTAVLPQFAPQTGVGQPAVRAYAAQAGQSVQDFLQQQPFPLLTPDIAGTATVELVQADAATVAPAYLLNGAGLQKLP